MDNKQNKLRDLTAFEEETVYPLLERVAVTREAIKRLEEEIQRDQDALGRMFSLMEPAFKDDDVYYAAGAFWCRVAHSDDTE